MDTLTAIFLSASIQFHLPPKLIDSLCFVESGHNVQAVHRDDGGTDSLGVCQVKLETAKWLGFKGAEKQLMKPQVNIYYAAKYLSKNIKRYGQINKAVIAYNRGHAGELTATAYSDKVLAKWSNTNADYLSLWSMRTSLP